MDCPKCTGESKGTLRITRGVLKNEKGQIFCGVTCDKEPHWFFIHLEILRGQEVITPAHLLPFPYLENAEEGLGQFDDVSEEEVATRHAQAVRKFPTIAEYRALKKRLRILLVDDEDQIRTSLTRAIMNNVNADVIPATNGEEAVEIFQMHGPFDLVITDYNMPKLNGLEAARNMLKMVPDQKIILMSADSEVAKEIKGSNITFRYKLGSAKDFIAFIEQLCK